MFGDLLTWRYLLDTKRKCFDLLCRSETKQTATTLRTHSLVESVFFFFPETLIFRAVLGLQQDNRVMLCNV